VTRLRDRRAGFDSRQGQEGSLYATAPKPALGSTQPPNQWVLRLFPRGWYSRGVKRYIPEDRTLHNHRCENLRSSHLRLILQSGVLPLSFPIRNLYAPLSSLARSLHDPSISFFVTLVIPMFAKNYKWFLVHALKFWMFNTGDYDLACHIGFLHIIRRFK
jgi:hypothetical protein